MHQVYLPSVPTLGFIVPYYEYLSIHFSAGGAYYYNKQTGVRP